MNDLIYKFFKKFLRKEWKPFTFFSLLRVFSFVQILFWPFALSKILDILGADIADWRGALPWVVAMIINKILEDFIRLRAKHGIQTVGSKLRINLVNFFSQETEIRSNVKTGEAVQRIKIVNDNISSATSYYKNSFLGIPVDLIAIPIIFFGMSPSYLYLLLTYIAIYLVIDRFTTSYYLQEAQEYFSASETFWGTLYRKTPDVWRGREERDIVGKKIDQEAQDLEKEIITMDRANVIRWTALQAISSFFKGLSLVLVFWRITQGETAIGDLVLVLSYISRTQSNLNKITSSNKLISELRMSLKRLGEVIQKK